MRTRMTVMTLLVLGLAACVSTNVVQLGVPGRFPPVDPDSVIVFLREADVEVEFEKVAIINAEGDYNFANDERLIGAMRKRAAKLGANAIIIGEFKEPSTVGKIADAVLGVPAERKGQVLAVRLKPAATPTVNAAPAARAPLVVKVDHFFATSPDAAALMSLFRDTLGLPEQWPYRRFGSFASGAVTLGNVVFEFVGAEAGRDTRFGWIAFEPAGSTEEAVRELARRGIAHHPPAPTLFPDSVTGSEWGWVNTMLIGMAGQGGTDFVFLCDYRPRHRVVEGRVQATAALVADKGGPLGVIGVQEVVVGVPDLETARVAWRKLLDSPWQEVDGAFQFGSGPQIRLVQADSSGIQRIVIRVASEPQARAFLAGKGLLEPGSDRELAIARRATRGLHIVLRSAPDTAPPPVDPAGPAGGTAHEYAYLEDEVQHLLSFLQGAAPVRPDLLADSVSLHVAPEGGGALRKLSRRELLTREAWRVGDHSLVPAAGLAHVRLTPGLHSNCQAIALETSHPRLARFPHVGARLAPAEGANCLQTWNATFIFSTDASAPRLTDVVYDQWEW